MKHRSALLLHFINSQLSANALLRRVLAHEWDLQLSSFAVGQTYMLSEEMLQNIGVIFFNYQFFFLKHQFACVKVFIRELFIVFFIVRISRIIGK